MKRPRTISNDKESVGFVDMLIRSSVEARGLEEGGVLGASEACTVSASLLKLSTYQPFRNLFSCPPGEKQ